MEVARTTAAREVAVEPFPQCVLKDRYALFYCFFAGGSNVSLMRFTALSKISGVK